MKTEDIRLEEFRQLRKEIRGSTKHLLVGSRVDRGNLTPSPSQVGSRIGAVLESPFPTPATSNAACGFPALRFLC